MSLILRFYGLSGHSHFTFFKICFLKFLAAPHSTWELSSRTRDQTHIPCVGGQNLNHWSTREAPGKPTQKESLFTLSYDLFPFSFHLCSKNLSTGGIPTLFKKFILSKYSCIPKWFSYICIHTHTHTHIHTYILFHILFHYGLSHDIKYSSLCYTVGTCCLSILHIKAYIC